MRDNSRHWLDALTDGQMLRDWLSLNAHFFLGVAYWTVGVSLFTLGLGLSLLLVGIPLLLLALAAVRGMASIDRQLTDVLLQTDTGDVIDDVDTRGANLGERLGMYLGSLTTWRSLIYLFLKLPLGALTFAFAWMMLPLLALEVLVLAPLTIDMRLITVRLLHWVAVGTHRGLGVLLPTAKRKRFSRLETIEADEQPRYFVDDGEIAAYKRLS